MPQPAHITLGTAVQAEYFLDSICDLYDAVFSALPFLWTDEESTHHRQMLTALLDNPTFGIALAKADNTLVGFAYGVALAPGTRWWQGFREELSDDFTQEWEGRTFALIDLAVQERWRRQGVGRQLVDCLLGSRGEERATLSVQPPASDAQAFYDRLGWRKVGRKDMPPGLVSPVFDVYVVELDAKP